MTSQSRRQFLHLTVSASLSGLVPLGLGCGQSAAGANPQDPAAFLAAVTKGDVEAVRRMIAADISMIGVKDDAGRSAYAIALLAEHRDVANQLQQAGYESDLHEAALAKDWTRFDLLSSDRNTELLKSVNGTHPIGGTAMHAAAAGGAGSDMWRVYGVCGDPDLVARGKTASSPLQTALRYSHLPTAEITAATLLANQADPNVAGLGDAPPLHIAASRGTQELVEMLVRCGADITAQNDDGQTAEQVAAAAGHEAVASMLDQHESIPRTHRRHAHLVNASGERYVAPDISDISIFDRNSFVGQSHRNLAGVKEGLAQDPRLAHSVAVTGEVCVEASAHMGQQQLVETLLDQGAQYSLPTAVVRNDQKSVKAFLAADRNRIYERGAHDFPLLWYPIIGNCPLEMMELLIQHGADVEQQHYLGTTALHWACLRGKTELVEYLIGHGADVNRRGRKFTPEGETPLDSAVGNDAISQMLLASGAK